MKTSFSIYILLLSIGLLFNSCSSSKIYTDRSQFVKDGQQLPTIQLDRYHSVQLRPEQDSSLAVALSISGGGSRAANFAIGVMLGLEKLEQEEKRNVLQEIDYISTVSGGGFAGGAYVASLYEHQQQSEKTAYSLSHYVDQHIRNDLRHSYTKTLIFSLFNPKIWFSHLDDGDALEKVIDDLVLGYKRQKSQANKTGRKARSLRLGDFFIDRDSAVNKVQYPMMVANASLLDKMGIFPFTPCIMGQYKINGYSHRMKKYEKVEKGFDIYEMPLAVGIKASGSFPALISNSTLRSYYHQKRKYLHVIDGAMTDNFGFATAAMLLDQDQAVKKKVLMVIDADNAGNSPTFAKKQTARLSFKVYGRLASSGLEARRLDLLGELKTRGERLDFIPIIFGFSRLIEGNEVLPPATIDIKKEQQRLIELMKTNMAGLNSMDLQILYELVTNISTKYTITDNEQELLLLTGQKIVQMQEKEIKAALNN